MLTEDVIRRTNVGCSRMDLSQTTGKPFCQSLACPTPVCLMRAGLLVSYSHPTPLLPSPRRWGTKHPFPRSVLWAELGKQNSGETGMNSNGLDSPNKSPRQWV
jgi:hypothetical protein